MANLAISAVCNQSCVYCFAVDHLRREEEQTFLSLDGFEERLDFLARSGIDEVRLLGGEPTMHPQFKELLRRTRATGKRVVLFTNGLMPDDALQALASIPSEECMVLVNVTPPQGKQQARIAGKQEATIRYLGERVILGVNLYRTDQDLDFLLPLVTGSSCKRSIRVGMAQPCLSGTNQYLVPNQYRAVAVRLLAFVRVAAKEGVLLDLDCGFVRCMFSDGEVAELRALGCKLEWRCNPILDIDLQGRVIHCFPLAQLASLPLTPDTDAPALRRSFEDLTRPYRQAGVYKECSTCGFKGRNECTGGCLAMTIRRFRHTSFRLEVPAQELAA